MIQQILASVIEGLEVEGSTPVVSPTFIHGWKGWNNLATDEVQNVVIILIEPVISQDKLVGSHIEEKYPLLLAFLERGNLDYTPEQELVLTDRMRSLRAKFVYALTNNTSIRYVEDIVTSDEFKVKGSCLSGCGLQVKVTPVNGQAVC